MLIAELPFVCFYLFIIVPLVVFLLSNVSRIAQIVWILLRRRYKEWWRLESRLSSLPHTINLTAHERVLDRELTIEASLNARRSMRYADVIRAK